MTEKQAALMTYIMWSWLERNPGKKKSQYHLFYELGFYKFISKCPWCDYYDGCDPCPLAMNNEMCINYIDGKPARSFYDTWVSYTYDDSQKCDYMKKRAQIAAGEIARVAWEEYKKLGG